MTPSASNEAVERAVNVLVIRIADAFGFAPDEASMECEDVRHALREALDGIDSEARRQEREKTLHSVCRRLCLDCYNGSPAEPDKANPTSGRWYHTRGRDGKPLPCGHSCEAQEVQQMLASSVSAEEEGKRG